MTTALTDLSVRPPLPVRQLMLRLLLAGHLPALLVVGALLLLDAQHARRQAHAEMERVTEVLSSEVDERVNSVQAHLLRLSDAVIATPLDLRALRAEAQVEEALAQVDGIVLFDADGAQLLNTRIPPGQPLAARTAGANVGSAIRLGRLAVSDVFLAPTMRAHIVGIGVPVLAGNQVRYGLTAALHPLRWTEFLERQRVPRGWSVTIVDRKGTVVGHSAEPERAGRSVSPQVLGMLAARASGRIDADAMPDVQGETAFRRSNLTGWSVLVHVPAATVDASVRRSAAILAAALLLLLVAGFLIALRLGRRISASIEQLAAGAQCLVRGETVRIPSLAFREADAFARNMEEASTTLHERDRTLRRVTQNFDRTLVSELESWQARVGRELHDSVGSSLGGVGLLLQAARTELPPSAVARSLVERSQGELRTAAELVRKISRGVMPVGTDPGALLPAIEQLVRDADAWPDTHCDLVSSGSFEHVAPEVGNHVFRIVQEALNNASKHGRAKRLQVKLLQWHGGYEAAVIDDGCGFEADAQPGRHAGVGLRSMRARAQAIGGTLLVCSQRGAGCHVHLAWQCEQATGGSPDQQR